MLVALGSLSKSSVLDRSSIGPFRSFLYFGILLIETTATSERLAQRGALERPRWFPQAVERFRCCHPTGHSWKRMISLLLSGGPFFFTHASPLFPVRRLWEFPHILIIFFFIQFAYLFIYLFIPNKRSTIFGPISNKLSEFFLKSFLN